MACPAVCNGALLQCTFGLAPSGLTVLPVNRTFLSGGLPMANIMDNRPLVNILPFGMCNNPANPAVAALTAAAMGVLTPAPCVPVTVAPWIPGAPVVLLGKMPALTLQSQLMCTWGGVIRVNFPGQVTVQLP
ncbi:TPA: DUF4280 domain-containing protein [Salmonella enterica]|uniref:DUF4280 domain-containing protein n=1 Tax=Salmonella enterica TaxID=28901 RepID=A0A747XH76_SALER|nr:DUF4280 domain-containing protein [Salmonella enterica]HAF4697572.1 DUF4280 domain-containing protein [Salmonella enterica]